MMINPKVEKILDKVKSYNDMPSVVSEAVEQLKPTLIVLRSNLVKSSQQSIEQAADWLLEKAKENLSQIKPDITSRYQQYPIQYEHHGISINPIKLLADIAGWRPGGLNTIWGGPRPITNLLIGGAIITGLGYGLGKIIEKAFPGVFEKGKLPKRTAILGAILSAIPALMQWYINYKVVSKDRPHDSTFSKILSSAISPMYKESASRFDHYDFDFDIDKFLDPYIHTDKMEKKIMDDRYTPIEDKAVVASLIHTSDILSRPKSKWVSPFDIMQTAITLGSGILQGYAIGKTVGILAGLKPEHERKLKNLGIWAGAISGIAQKLKE